ncbi:hypothetical protein SAMN04487912_102342 [Arthrobacter sp. cf158]|uniref:hypothetical protein n=1 Tax=Arthrobacter sp. cf158 TaxID=1761744 RepID=UPI00089A3657|nr:hypothetical protein [Arthrobacter sp. cf158]SDW32783.1 hypothetical protein SAMN04487912_102342 [Arthrobacter sp. cf158]
MSIIDNQAQGNVRDFDRRLRALEHASNMNSAAIGRGGIRVHSGGVITIENGGLMVTGTAEIIGRLIASGLVTFIGDVVISGPLDVSGTVDVSGVMTVLNDLEIASGGLFKAGDIELRPDGSAKFGSMEIDPSGKITSGSATINPDGSATFGEFTIAANGDLQSDGSLDINGPATLNSDLTVAPGKTIKLGDLTLENTGAGGGVVNFPNGSVSSTPTLGMLIVSSVALELAAPNLKLSGLPTTTGVEPNLYMDGSGNIKRIIP